MMIILDDKYRIDADTYGYMLYRDGGVDTKGKPLRLGQPTTPQLAKPYNATTPPYSAMLCEVTQ